MAFGKSERTEDGKVRAKRRLLDNRFKDFHKTALASAIQLGDFDESWLRRIEMLDDDVTIVHFIDGSNCEMNPNNQSLTIFGDGIQAGIFAKLAAEFYFPWGANENAVVIGEKTSSASRGNNSPWTRSQQKNADTPDGATRKKDTVQSSKLSAEDRAARWRSHGYKDVWVDERSVWIRLEHGARLQDHGSSIDLYGAGQKAAIKAIIQKSIDDWGGKLLIEGDEATKAKLWLEAQRCGVEVLGFVPSPSLQRKAARERNVKAWLHRNKKPDGELSLRAKDARLAGDRIAPETPASEKPNPEKPASSDTPHTKKSGDHKPATSASSKPAFGGSFAPVHTWLDKGSAQAPEGAAPEEAIESEPAAVI